MTPSRRVWVFAAIAWTVFTAGALALSLMMATTETAKGSGAMFAVLAAVLFGPAVLVGGAALAVLRVRIKQAAGIAGMTAGVLVAVMMVLMAGGMLHAPRYLAYGHVRGTVAEVAGKNGASVEITPAFVDLSRIGRGSENAGHSTTVRYAAPIVGAAGERDLAAAQREPIVLFMCDSSEAGLRAAAARPGPVAGRMHPMTLKAEKRAVDDIRDLTRGDGEAQCVVPDTGGSTLWVILWVLLMLGATLGGAAMAVAIAAPDSTPPGAQTSKRGS